MGKTKMKRCKEDRLFIGCNYIVAFLFLISTFYPLCFIVAASFSSGTAVANGEVWIIPKDFTLAGYEMMLEKTEIWKGYGNTIFYTLVGTGINLLFTIPAAYALSKKTLPFRRMINIYFLVPMFIGGGLIPTYILINNLHLVDTVVIIVLLGAVSIYNLIVCRTFFESSISNELVEAAKIDGCSEMKIFIKIVLPLSKALLAVMVLFFSVSHWNSFYNAMIYLRDKDKYPLQLILRNLLLTSQMESVDLNSSAAEQMLNVQSMKYGVIIVASLPVFILYPFIQKYFVKGVMIGAVKG